MAWLLPVMVLAYGWCAKPYAVVPLPMPAPCPAEAVPGIEAVPRMIVPVIDDSGSMSWSDPRGRRYPEMRTLMSWISRHSCSPKDLGAVVHFGNTASVVGPASLRKDVGRLREALAGPDRRVGEGTMFAPAVARLERILANHQDVRTTIIVLTDGDTKDEVDWSSALNALPAKKFVVALGTEVPAAWSRLDLQGMYSLDDAGFGDIARQLAHAWGDGK